MYSIVGSYAMLFVILLLFIAGVVYMDLRSRRGWGLTLLALALSCYGVWLASIFTASQPSPSARDNLAAGLILVVYVAIYLTLATALWVGALVEAGAARHWRWFFGLIAATLLTLATVTLGPRLGAPGFTLIGFAPFLVPAITMLAYGIARIVRPFPLPAV